MRLIVHEDYAAASEVAADRIDSFVKFNPTANILPASGNTPELAYKLLAGKRRRWKFNPAGLKIFQADEYLGLQANDERTLWGWTERAFIKPLGLSVANAVRFHTDTTDPIATCQAWDDAVESAGGLDLAILGVGPPPKAHLCFNDAPCLPTDNSRVVTLPEETLDSNGIYWGGRHRVPPQAMTAGMRQLLASKEILVIISGAKKRSCLYSMCLGPVTKDVTASYLQLHDNVTVIADRAAAGSLADGFWPRV